MYGLKSPFLVVKILGGVFMDIKNIVPVEWSNQRVLTSVQLAEAYECSVDRIKDNFNANKKHYKESVHYFKITGSDLQKLRVGNSDLQISPMTRVLYLWTYQGCVRHCKSINTPKAWQMFDKLEQHYFNTFVAPVVAKPAKTKNPKRVAGQKTPASIYVAQMKDNFHIVKIGQSHDPESRLPQIKGLNRKDFYKTILLPRKVARLLEQVCHEIFAPHALGNELFGIEYDEACRIIRALEKFAAGLSEDQNFEHDDKALTIAKNFLVEAANNIADKKF